MRQYDTENPDQFYGGGDYEVRVTPASAPDVSRKIPAGGTAQAGSFALSPNPTNGRVAIQYTGTEQKAGEMIVSDMAGKTVLKEKVVFEPGVSREVNLSRFAGSTYLISITDAEGKVETYKVIRK